ncbi:MAG: DUF1932 domain-containing protein [Pseudomonadota bacterium]
MRIALLHPGAMGASVGQALLDSGHEVCWCAAGRSRATHTRAAPFTPFESMAELLAAAEGVVSVCPPDQAVALAQSVVDSGYRGLYVDANAVAPATARRIADLVGAGYVDGGLIGPPARQPDTTRLYLSGTQAADVAAWFTDGFLAARVVDDAPTSASALKMAYAGYTKGVSALLLAVNAMAEQAGVRDALLQEWALSQPGLAARSASTAQGTAGKAWRFAGEMQEIANSFAEFGLPPDFHLGAAVLYTRMQALKDQPDADLHKVMAEILNNT